MTLYEKARVQLRAAMDSEIESLDTQRSILGETEYWNQFKLIHSTYAKKVAEVDDAERSRRNIQQAKETGIKHDRPEQRYVDVMGQLKAQKMTEIISKLSECSSTERIDNLSTEDPFYHDKMDPIGTFERWWDEEMQSFPSYDYMQDFLRRVDINEQGFLVYKQASSITDNSSSTCFSEISVGEAIFGSNFDTRLTQQEMNLAEYQGILKETTFKTARQKSAEKRALQQTKIKMRSPLLASPDYVKSVENRKRKSAKQENIVSRLTDVIYAYDLNPELEALLIEHVEAVCVPLGLVKEDQYKPMLEQFLRYVDDNNRRLEIVRISIERGWRILSDGSI